ncbi:MAG: hypothetical protein QW734_08560 [Candidatus Bathyarchaeia archaeon]
MFRIIRGQITTMHRTKDGLKLCEKVNCKWCAAGAEKVFGVHCVEEETGFERMVFLTGAQLAELIDYKRRQKDRVGTRFEIVNGHLKIAGSKNEENAPEKSSLAKELEMTKADLELALKLLEKALERLEALLKCS